MGKVLLFFVIALVVSVTAPLVYAGTGYVSGASSRIDLPINQGPGFLLPTSPFYFADILKNNLRLLLASYDNSQKAKIHLDIAGERIAEVKIMLQEKNMPQRALDMALSSMTEHIEGARVALLAQKNSGRNVAQVASDLNTQINEQKDALRILAGKTDTDASLKMKAVLAKVRQVEIGIEDEMAADVLNNEIVTELTKAIQNEMQDVLEAQNRAATLQAELAKRVPSRAEASKSGVKASVVGVSTENSSQKDASESPQ